MSTEGNNLRSNTGDAEIRFYINLLQMLPYHTGGPIVSEVIIGCDILIRPTVGARNCIPIYLSGCNDNTYSVFDLYEIRS